MTVMPDASSSAQRIVVLEDAESALVLARMLGAAGYETVHTTTTILCALPAPSGMTNMAPGCSAGAPDL